jgi:hypothetical protein
MLEAAMAPGIATTSRYTMPVRKIARRQPVNVYRLFDEVAQD